MVISKTQDKEAVSLSLVFKCNVIKHLYSTPSRYLLTRMYTMLNVITNEYI